MPIWNRTNILLTVLIAAVVILTVVWILIPDHPPGTENPDGLNKGGETAKTVSGPRAAAGDEEPARADGSGGEDDYPLVMRLMDSYRKREIFGSFRIISIIAHETDPESSRATIEDRKTGSNRTYSVNDTLPDESRLAGIEQDYVVLEKSGVRKRIFLDAPGQKSFGGAVTGFRKINEGEFDLNPYGVFSGDASRALDFTMKVHSRDGEMEGIQVSGIGNHPLFRSLGLREDDVLVEVNGKPVDTLLNSVRACINAYYSDDVQLKILRNGKIIDLTYHLYWEGQGSWTPGEILKSKAVSSLFDGGFASHLF